MLYCTTILDIADSQEHEHKIPGDWDFYVAEKGGFCLASHLAVARFGLATASRFRLLAKHRCGVRIPTDTTPVVSSFPP